MSDRGIAEGSGTNRMVCRDCLTITPVDQTKRKRCPNCGSPRTLAHPELFDLSFAHIDCDAFFAAVEKLDDPSLEDKPVIIGGGKRGVVSTCCYIARMSGVRSAMPMFKARELCPDAVIIKPRMQRYVDVGREIRRRMLELTPLVEPLSIDEAFLDLTGTERVHHGAPALTLMRFAKSIEDEVGVTVSVGLSHNKSMAKLASDLDKPRGFAVIGEAETVGFLAPQPVRALFGVGEAMARSLDRHGYRTLADLQGADVEVLWKQFGDHGPKLKDQALGIDRRAVRPDRARKSVSSERTFHDDIKDLEQLRVIARSAAERVSKQLKDKGLSGRTVTLKIKTARFRTLTRSHTLSTPTQSADRLFRTVEPLLAQLADGTAYRLLGVGISELGDAADADDRDLADIGAERRTRAEQAMDSLRTRFGDEAVNVGLMLGDDGRGRSAKSSQSQLSQAQPSPSQPSQGSGRNASKSDKAPRNEKAS